MLAAVGNDCGSSPLTIAIARLLDLKPPTTDALVGDGIIRLFQICESRPLVAGIHDVVGSRGERVAPMGLDCAPSLDCDDCVCRHGRVGASVASKVVAGHVGNWPIICGGPHAVRNGMDGASGLELNKNGMSRSRSCCCQESIALHHVEAPVGYLEDRVAIRAPGDRYLNSSHPNTYNMKHICHKRVRYISDRERPSVTRAKPR